MKKWLIILTAVLLIVVLTVLTAEQRSRKADDKSNDDSIIEAMYVPFGDTSYVMVDLQNSTPFTVNRPPEIYDINSNTIGFDDLKKGNIVDIYGNGIMAESYPGQYHGVTKIQVKNEGSPKDADQYQNIIDSIYSEPDPAERPYLNVEYRTDNAVVTTAATEGGYSWTYKEETGNDQSVASDPLHILLWPDIVDITLEKPTDLTLSFSKKPDNVTVTRFNSTYLGSQEYAGDVPLGEEVSTTGQHGRHIIEGAEKGYVYLIQGEWNANTIDYGFMAK